MKNKSISLRDYEIETEFLKKINGCFTIVLSGRSAGKKAFLESLGYNVVTYKELNKNKKGGEKCK